MDNNEDNTESYNSTDSERRKIKTRRRARCISCDATWTPKNGTAMEPPRCPNCFSRRTVWDDEYQSPAEKPIIENKPATTTTFHPTNTPAPVEITVAKQMETPEWRPDLIEDFDDYDDDEADDGLPEIYYAPKVIEKPVKKPHSIDSCHENKKESSISAGSLIILAIIGIGGFCLFKHFTQKRNVKSNKSRIEQTTPTANMPKQDFIRGTKPLPPTFAFSTKENGLAKSSLHPGVAAIIV